MVITEPGIYRDMASAEYFADPCPAPSLTQSICKILIDQSPLHARQAHPRLAKPMDGLEDEPEAEKYDKAKAIGNGAHRIMLGRGKTLAVIDAPNFKGKAAQTDRDAAVQRGEEPILRKHRLVAHAMTLAAKLQLQQIDGCERAFKDGDGEVVAACLDGDLWLRAMIDWITPDLREIWDYKTSGMSAAPWSTGKMMVNAGWDVQAAMIERILDTLDPAGAGRRKFRFVCQENEPPFALTVNELSESALTMGRKRVQHAIDEWRRAINTGVWPAYPARIILPEYPAFRETEWLNREVAHYEERQAQKPTQRLTSLAGG